METKYFHQLIHTDNCLKKKKKISNGNMIFLFCFIAIIMYTMEITKNISVFAFVYYLYFINHVRYHFETFGKKLHPSSLSVICLNIFFFFLKKVEVYVRATSEIKIFELSRIKVSNLWIHMQNIFLRESSNHYVFIWGSLIDWCA